MHKKVTTKILLNCTALNLCIGNNLEGIWTLLGIPPHPLKHLLGNNFHLILVPHTQTTKVSFVLFGDFGQGILILSSETVVLGW